MGTLINIGIFFLLKAIWSPLAYVFLGFLILSYTWPYFLYAFFWLFGSEEDN